MSARGTSRPPFFNVSSSTWSSVVSQLLVWYPLTLPLAVLSLNTQVWTSSPYSLLTDDCYAGVPIRSVDLTFCQAHASSILERSPVSYVSTMQLHGSLFSDNCNTAILVLS